MKHKDESEKKKYITLGDEPEEFEEGDELEKHAFGEHPDDYEYFDAPFYGNESCDSKGKRVLFWLVASVLVAGVIAIFCAISSDEYGD